MKKEEKVFNIVTIKEMPQSERPREKLMKYGVSSLSNAELLAILIGTGTKKYSALSLANSILSLEEQGISHLTECSPEELIAVYGIGTAKACQVVAAIEVGKRIASHPRKKRLHVECPEEVAALFMEEMRYLKKEVFKILLLNTKNEILSVENASVGNLNSSIVHPREIFAMAVKKSASSMIAFHNHPSGNPEPSVNDLDITQRLREAGAILGIPLLDHIIIGDGIFVSLKQRLLM